MKTLFLWDVLNILSAFDSSSIQLRQSFRVFEKYNKLYIFLFLYSCDTQINHMLGLKKVIKLLKAEFVFLFYFQRGNQ